jgi:thymidylate synthase ThyX
VTIQAEVVCDSINPMGHRLTTIVGTCHRFVLAELNTHRLFSRNSASSRAIPTHKRIQQVLDDPAIPIEFGANQPGMQAGAPIESEWEARSEWLTARDEAVVHAQRLADLGVHKQVVNRLLEPFMWHTVVISSTMWENFFEQRCSPLAQPEIRVFAECIKDVYDASKPQEVDPGGFHLPFVTGQDIDASPFDLLKISAARCARTSYETHDGVIDIAKDIELYDKLVSARPMHASPLEHVAEALSSRTSTLPSVKPTNFHPSWMQLRSLVEAQQRLHTRQ